MSTAGILALRRGWVQGGRAPGLAAASLPTEAAAAVRPSVCPSVRRLRGTAAGCAGGAGAGAAHSSQFPSVGGSESRGRAGRGRLPAAINSSGASGLRGVWG